MRNQPIYHSTYTGRPPDEPAVLGVALNEVFVPILQKQFPEITDFYLPPEGCSYRFAVVTIKKQYPGHAKRVMMGVWSFLRQFMYTKFVLVCDESVDGRDWGSVVEAIGEHFEPQRDLVLIENTPIDSLDFASPVAGLGSKMGLDVTEKWQAELDIYNQPNQGESAGLTVNEQLMLVETFKQANPQLLDIHIPQCKEHSKVFGSVIVSIDKQLPNQVDDLIESIKLQLSGKLPLKMIIVCDADVQVNDWNDVIWAVTTRMDATRDTHLVEVPEQGSSFMLMDATNKLSDEVQREWGRPIQKDPKIVSKIDEIWGELNIL